MEIKPKSNRVLSVFTLVMINVIAIDSLRNLPFNAKAGFLIITLYAIGAILFLIPCALITAELATHRPKNGGVYVWVRDAFGPQWGFVTIWLQWIYNVVWYPTILSFIAANIAFLIDPQLSTNKEFMVLMVIGMFALATLVNILGMRVSGLVSVISAIGGTLIPMLAIIFLGGYWLLAHKTLAIAPSWQGLLPDFNSWHNLSILVVVLFSLMGLEMSAVHAEDVKKSTT